MSKLEADLILVGVNIQSVSCYHCRVRVALDILRDVVEIMSRPCSATSFDDSVVYRTFSRVPRGRARR